MIKNKTYLVLLTSLGLGACTVGPDYQAPQISFVDKWFSSESKRTTQDPIDTKWWNNFNDPLLINYIEQAAINNKDVQIATANILRARAVKRESVSRLLPTISNNSSAERSSSSDNIASFNGGDVRNLFDSGFDASWEIDFFGGTRREGEAAQARLDSAKASYDDVMLTTLSDVARLYYEARGLQKRIDITQKNVTLFNQTYELIKKRLEVGEATQFDVARALGEYQTTQARLPNLKADLQSTIFSLSVLLGQPPEALLDTMMTAQDLPPTLDIVPVGLRSDILRRRPDIKMAERELAASTADIGVQTAELFPKFFVTGDVGSQSRTFGDLFTAAGGLWSLGSVMQWSIFEGGAIRARIDIEKAENKAALAMHEKTILEALADVQSALTRYGRELETRQKLEESVQSRLEAFSLVEKLLDAGEIDYLEVLDSQRDLTVSEDNLVLSETQAVTKLIALYTALGGGWTSKIPSSD